MKKVLATALALAMTLSITACGGGASSSGQPGGTSGGPSNSGTPSTASVTIQLGHGQTEAHPYHLGAAKFAELVDTYTNGTVKVEIFPNGTLGAERDMVEGVSMGTVNACITTNAPLTNFKSNFNVYEFPYLFASREEAHKVLDSEIGQSLMDELESINIVGLAYFENGFRNITNNKREIASVQDLNGLKIRTMESEIHLAAFRAMGANPTPMNWGEVYTALAQGTIDGQENPAMAILDGKIYEVNRYLSLTEHFYSPAELLISADLFNSLTAEQQEGVKKAAAEACTYQREQAGEFNQNKLDTLKENGMTIAEVDKSSFQEATQSVYDDYQSQYGAQLDEIRAMLK